MATELISPQSLVTLEEAKLYLDRSSGTQDDEKIARLINYATGQIEGYCARRLKQRTFDGTDPARPYLFAGGRGDCEIEIPEYPLAGVHELAYHDTGSDTYIPLDLAGMRFGPSLVYLARAVFPWGDHNIRCKVTAGIPGTLEVVAGANDKLDFNDGAGVKVATIVAGVYASLEALAVAVTTAMNAASSSWAVSYSRATRKVTISRPSGNLTLKWLTGANLATSIGPMLGYYMGADDASPSGAATFLADYERDAATLEWKGLSGLALRWVQVMFLDQTTGIGRGSGLSVGGESVSLIDSPMPKDIERGLARFRRRS